MSRQIKNNCLPELFSKLDVVLKLNYIKIVNKIEDDLNIKEQLLEAREKQLREIEIEMITNNTKLMVNTYLLFFKVFQLFYKAFKVQMTIFCLLPL